MSHRVLLSRMIANEEAIASLHRESANYHKANDNKNMFALSMLRVNDTLKRRDILMKKLTLCEKRKKL